MATDAAPTKEQTLILMPMPMPMQMQMLVKGTHCCPRLLT